MGYEVYEYEARHCADGNGVDIYYQGIFLQWCESMEKALKLVEEWTQDIKE